jgi:hypothetical protein
MVHIAWNKGNHLSQPTTWRCGTAQLKPSPVTGSKGLKIQTTGSEYQRQTTFIDWRIVATNADTT